MEMEKTNIILIIMDSAREDHMSYAGYKKETTPNLDNFVKSSTVFLNTYPQSPWSLPSHTSLFTGLYPSEHGLTRGNLDRSIELGKSILTLAEILKGEGYRTGGFSCNPWVGKLSRLNRGFDFFLESTFESSNNKEKFKDLQLKVKVINKFDKLIPDSNLCGKILPYILKRRNLSEYMFNSIKRWIERDQSTPFFIFANFMDPHPPYSPDKKYLKKFSSENFSLKKFNLNLRKYNKGHKYDYKTEEKIKQRYNICYDASLNYLDYKIGDFLYYLEKKGYLKNSMITLTSDHGKGLGEYSPTNELGNLMDVYLKVPLILYYPPVVPKNKRISQPVELSDIYFTILDFIGIKRVSLSTANPKISLLDVINDKKRHVYIYGEYDIGATKGRRQGDRVYCIIQDGLKYLYSNNFGLRVFQKRDSIEEEIEIEDESILEDVKKTFEKHKRKMLTYNEKRKISEKLKSIKYK